MLAVSVGVVSCCCYDLSFSLLAYCFLVTVVQADSGVATGVGVVSCLFLFSSVFLLISIVCFLTSSFGVMMHICAPEEAEGIGAGR